MSNRMTTSWRRLALAAVLYLVAGAGVATAQTILVRKAPAGAPVEVLFDGSRLVAGKADEAGDAKLPIMLQVAKGDWESDVHVYVDVCGATIRVGLVDRLSLPPTPSDGCERRDVPGLFVMKALTTLLVDVGGGARAQVWLRQGPVPKEWLVAEGEIPERPSIMQRKSPTGLVLFGGWSTASFTTGVTPHCGNVADCSLDNAVATWQGGGEIWVARFLAIGGSYVKPRTLNATGNGSAKTYHFTTTLETQFIDAFGKVAAPIGPFRIYGIGGITYHRAARTTTQVNDETTITVNGENVTVPGNTQSWAQATDGIGYLWGGGGEAWLTRRFGIYGEITRAKVTGSGLSNTEGTINDHRTLFSLGVQFKIGKK